MNETPGSGLHQRLAQLPEEITLPEVAWLAGRSEEAVRKWRRSALRPAFPTAVGKRGAALTYPRDQVGQWLADYLAQGGNRGGPRRREDLNPLSTTDHRRLTDREMAELRGVTPDGITDYERRYGDAADPFPARDSAGRRSVAEVAAWFERHTPSKRRGPLAGRARTAGAEDSASDLRAQLTDAFAQLPARCTRADIAAATGAALVTVTTWAARPDFPAPVERGVFVPGQGKKPDEYTTTDVAQWCLEHLHAQPTARADR